MGVGWEDEKHATLTYGLEPFEFHPGPQPSQEELTRDAEIRVRSDKRFREALSKEKAAITAILQTCLEKVNGQLERGEDICQKAHFPLLNPRDFDDLESFARHDHFSVDLRVDKVDEALQKLVSSLFGIVWTNVHVENESKAKSLDRFCQALQERMETLEYHLQDRSKQLSNCRYAYFLEITHLRNQLYIKNQSDDENFEPVEAYFFDPTEYLEEELRQQLNDKITLSVKVYRERLNAKCREVADLQLQLETLQALNAARNDDNLEGHLQITCNKHGAKNVVETLAKVAEKEMKEWAQIARGGKTPHDSAQEASFETSPGRLEQMRQAMMQAAQEAEQERIARLEAEKALQEALQRIQQLENQIEKLKHIDAGLSAKAETLPVQAASMVDPKEMDMLRKELARMKLQLDKERSRNAEMEQLEAARASEARAKMEDYDDAHAVLKEAQEVHKTRTEESGPTESLTACAEEVVGALKERSDELRAISKGTAERLGAVSTGEQEESAAESKDLHGYIRPTCSKATQTEDTSQNQPLTRPLSAQEVEKPLTAGSSSVVAGWDLASQVGIPRSDSFTALKAALVSVYSLKDGNALPPPRRPKSSPGIRPDGLLTEKPQGSLLSVAGLRSRPGAVCVGRSNSFGALQAPPLSVYGLKKTTGLPPPRRPKSSPGFR